jgi:hypothetical protein
MAPPALDFYETVSVTMTPAECGALGPRVRLDNGEDPAEMTRAARESDNHPSKLARYLKAVREADPSLSDEEAVREAELARSEHYAQMGRRSSETRRQTRAARAELDRIAGLA